MFGPVWEFLVHSFPSLLGGLAGALILGVAGNLLTPFAVRIMGSSKFWWKAIFAIFRALEIAKIEAWVKRPALAMSELIMWVLLLQITSAFLGLQTFALVSGLPTPIEVSAVGVGVAMAMECLCVDKLGTAYWALRSPRRRINYLMRRGNEFEGFDMALEEARAAYEVAPIKPVGEE